MYVHGTKYYLPQHKHFPRAYWHKLVYRNSRHCLAGRIPFVFGINVPVPHWVQTVAMQCLEKHCSLLRTERVRFLSWNEPNWCNTAGLVRAKAKGKKAFKKKNDWKGFKLCAQQSKFSQNAEDQMRRPGYSNCYKLMPLLQCWNFQESPANKSYHVMLVLGW